MNWAGELVTFVQLFFAVVVGLYFWNLLRGQQGTRTAVERESRKEREKWRRLREISLTEPLAEKTRPASLAEVVGQEEGIRALRAALCGPNPQHVLVYGPPGVGKTAAARLILEEAKRNPRSPFKEAARFVEIDATTARFDERGIADPLLGSVHDPIYQGAGPLGMAGVPQPKPGAVTRAHGGVLFIDEIGELHPIQMNKLLKVLEDRKVFLESAYYNAEDPAVPGHIKDLFDRGLPADFRMVGATTRMPSELPSALRSRCVEVFFRQLAPEEVGRIAEAAGRKVACPLEPAALEVVRRYAVNGREAVNIVQLAAGLEETAARGRVGAAALEWVVNHGQYQPRPERRVPERPQVGRVNALAVYGPNLGALLELEVVAGEATPGCGTLAVTGVVDEEETGAPGRRLKRRGTARTAVENVLTVLRRYLPRDPTDYHIHINFPGGTPVDGPSAGVAMALGVYSAVVGQAVDNRVALTGELSVQGLVKAVGGIPAKLEAARRAGAQRVLIPRENRPESSRGDGMQVIPVGTFQEVLEAALLRPAAVPGANAPLPASAAPVSFH